MKWQKLPAEFVEGLKFVLDAAGKNETQYATTCVHFHPDYIEACNNHIGVRCDIQLGIDSEFLVRGKSLKPLLKEKPTEFSITPTTIQFRDGSRWLYETRRDQQEYEPLDELLKVEGVPVVWPKALTAVMKQANPVSRKNVDCNEVVVRLADDVITVLAIAHNERFETSLPIDYKHAPICFTTSPHLFMQLIPKYAGEWTLTTSRLRPTIFRSAAVSAWFALPMRAAPGRNRPSCSTTRTTTAIPTFHSSTTAR